MCSLSDNFVYGTLEYRHCQKLMGTYIQSFTKRAVYVPEEVSFVFLKMTVYLISFLLFQKNVARIFASWQHTGTATGRISVTEPVLFLFSNKNNKKQKINVHSFFS